MSYSFQTKSSTKAEAKEKVAAELAKVVQGQPVHVEDAQQAKAAADAFIDLLHADESMDVHVNVNGSLGWKGQTGEHAITSANVGVSAYLALKNQQPL